MSVFDEHITDNPTSTITADFLRDIIKRRWCSSKEPIEVICEKLLDKIYKEVEYTVTKDVYEHYISPAVMGINSIFKNDIDYGNRSQYIDKDSQKITRESLNPRFIKLIDFFEDRGFNVYVNFGKYDEDNSASCRCIRIDWKKERNK